MTTPAKQIILRRTLAMCLAICGGCGLKPSHQPPSRQQAPPTASASEVHFEPGSPKLAQIRLAKVETILAATGQVTAPGKVEVNSNRIWRVFLPVAGRVIDVTARTGDFVSRGQPLLRVESPDTDAAVAALQQAQAAVTQAQSSLAKAQLDLDRTRDLYAHGAVPLKEVANLEAILTQAKAAVNQAKAAEEQARRKLEILGVTPDSYGQPVVLRAPVSGKVIELNVANGEYRNDLSDALMTIADLSTLWITSEVAETDIRHIRLKAPISFRLAAYPGEIFHGRVLLISDMLDPQTRTVKVRSEMPNPDGRLKPEMYGTVELADRMEPCIAVPAQAVLSHKDGNFVWRLKNPGTFERVRVLVADQRGDRVLIRQGLRPGDQIVVDGVLLLGASNGDQP
ncbi:MAG: efflux RND transporter periplasmic adaptor subunit [Bryobacteraceae bacterium]|nr:efflux RND transporter periplasmic adaptor subunit [Bryobacteraceae bacterium]MDW8378366.1 efflux RND transporter periplasmic adaptor subunit [Bryobacterales bacterium]